MAFEKKHIENPLADEKGFSIYDHEKVAASTPAESVDEVTWTADEEKRLVRKIDRLVIPLLIMAFFALQLDRGK
jgi:hypothetical protein